MIPTAKIPARGSQRKRLGLASAAIFATSALVAPSLAQEALSPGEAISTRFSGTIEITLGDGTRLPLINEDGVVASAVDLRNPGFAADGRHWSNEPQHLAVTAAEIGQVFGIALDDATAPNVYLTASSAYGLHRFDDGSGWLPGQWGEGGPGGLYRLDAQNGYAPELLTIITLDGRQNTGAGLGNVAFDRSSGQVFVSDLETGMIHRLTLDGTEIDRFDHGVDGRINFTEAATGAIVELAAIAFDPASQAQFDDCADNSGAGSDFTSTPSCWNYADFRRRVWGLALHTDPVTADTRLYYSVSGADGLGAAGWETAGDDANNSVWSIGFGADGGFNAADVRREIILPALGGGDTTARAVPDLAISPEGVLLIAERGSVRNLGLDQPEPFAAPHAARVLRYFESDTGLWTPDGRYDVGFNDRRTLGQPFIRANAAGGVDFGYGYDQAGAIDAARPLGSVWISGDSLCSSQGPCVDPATGQQTDTDEVHGLQGTPFEAIDDLLPAGATAAYPDDGTPYPADAVLASYLIDLDANIDESGAPLFIESLKNDATKIGDVEVYRAGDAGPGAVPQPTGYDLDIDKSGAVECLPGTQCDFTIKLTNNGPAAFTGPLYLWDVVQPLTVPLVGADGDGWSCFDFDTGIHCVNPGLELGAGLSTQFVLSLAIPSGYNSDILTNCVGIQWLYNEAGGFDIRAVQIALALLGYDAGPIDGIMGGRTANALSQFQSDNGLDVTGEIDLATASLLYPDHVGIAGDLDETNDFDCHDVGTRDPDPVHSKWNSHLKAGSPHKKAQSHLKIGSPHKKVQSHLKIGSPHKKAQSHLKIGSPHKKAQSHLKIGSPHKKAQSHLKIGSPHKKVQSHLKIGSPHKKVQSHLKIGSPHKKVQSHLKIGSPHKKAQSHLKIGSPHKKAQSHLKIGSPHKKAQSHLKVGSPHKKAQSHLKIGSPHKKAQSHLKIGSPHK
ncbi:peptidoglycan-binding protein, partial [Hoeflea sp. YIM 152468]|uniref:peptidoglycan-binding domain-containing protein n=1 Tax=Hoeflea sp. YIM 152468 TaxID=3031759 RepID=UPI0023DC2E8A